MTRAPTHKPAQWKEDIWAKNMQVIPERKNVLEQTNKDPTVNGRKADGACMWMYMSPCPDADA